MNPPLFTIDRDYDEDKASDGISRYGAYLAQRYERALEEEDLDGPERWAAWCWYVATPPVMVPGFVRRNDPVLGAEVYRDDWKGELAARLKVASPWPARLPGRWRSWDRNLAGSLEYPELLRAGAPTALATITFEVILEDIDVPTDDFRDRATLVDVAARTVAAVADAIQAAAGDAVAALWAPAQA